MDKLGPVAEYVMMLSYHSGPQKVNLAVSGGESVRCDQRALFSERLNQLKGRSRSEPGERSYEVLNPRTM